jgi:hypothetical protein
VPEPWPTFANVFPLSKNWAKQRQRVEIAFKSADFIDTFGFSSTRLTHEL